MKKSYLPFLTNREISDISRSRPVLLLPVGTTESNGPHQLLGCDFIIAEELAKSVANTTTALRMPTMHYGVSELHSTLPGTFAISAGMFEALLESVLDSASANGFDKVLVFNCHRNNHQPIEVLARKYRRENKLAISVIDPLEVVKDVAHDLFSNDPKSAAGHGGEPLYSLICHLYPDDVRPDLVEDGSLASFNGLEAISSTRFKFLNSRVGAFPLVHEINAAGAWANVSNGSAERGKEAFKRLCEFTSNYVEEFSKLNLSDS